jgi:hypothetical protein
VTVKVATDFCQVFELRSAESWAGNVGPLRLRLAEIGRGRRRCDDQQNQVLEWGRTGENLRRGIAIGRRPGLRDISHG